MDKKELVKRSAIFLSEDCNNMIDKLNDINDIVKKLVVNPACVYDNESHTVTVSRQLQEKAKYLETLLSVIRMDTNQLVKDMKS